MHVARAVLVLIGGGYGALGAAIAEAAAPAAVTLHECRLEHPLRLSSVAAQCGGLTVPEDRGAPGGATIALRFAVVPALNRRSTAPPLFLLAGGPGQSAIDLYVSFAAAFARINRSHDIVLVDQRGTGTSAPLRCRYPDDWSAGAADLPVVRQATLDCLSALGERVRYYTTSYAVADLDDVRRALGYEKISLYGSSYGTRVAQLYVRRHPAAVDAVILDGVTYPEQAIGPDTPEDGEHALRQILARCQENRDCAAAYPRLGLELADLRRRFGPERFALTIADPSSGAPLPIEINRDVFGAALRFLSYSAVEASLLPTLIHQAAQGHWAPLAAQTVMTARQIGNQLASGMQNSVICSEDVPFYVAADIDRARMSLTYQGTEQLDALQEICRLWPHGPVDRDLHAALHSDVPALLLSGEADPVTPPADAERAARGFSRHRHLVLAGEGHGQLATACVPRLMAEFLDAPDPRRLDAGCLALHQPPPFFLSLTGPAP